ncbi:NAD(P)/FAD-dependent oxidoreductase [Frondihabitans cladoniiphilus]|uniref:FAD-binding oxidoreductase n=1 Tax=Frondihabitans cladoniiphilus TaxID=715785 RepID=A0ABP8W4B0_9MICO
MVRDPLSVVVIGSGVAGASTAFDLARGGARVTVVDADLVGTATNAGAGIIQPWSGTTTGAFYDLYAQGARYYPDLVRALADLGEHETGYGRPGALVVNADPAKLDAVAARLAERIGSAPEMGDVSRLTAVETRMHFPPLAEGLPGIHLTGGARVDGRLLRRALLAAARRLGAEVVEGRARLEERGTGILVTVGDSPLAVDAVVLATGAWTPALLAGLGRPLALEPQRGQITHLRLDGVDTSGWPSVHPIAGNYLVAFDDSRVVAGATRETGSGFDPRVTAGGQRQVLEDALALAPGLADATLLETRVGLRPAAGRELPFVGALPGGDGVWVNAGFGAAGLTMGPVVGRLLARRILGEAVPELEPLAL